MTPDDATYHALIADALALRRTRLDQPTVDVLMFARQTAAFDLWDYLMRQPPWR